MFVKIVIVKKVHAYVCSYGDQYQILSFKTETGIAI